MAEFKKISDVDVINTLSDNDNVVIIGSDGAIKQTSSSNLGMDITKTEVVEEMAEDDKVVLVSNGEVKQVPVSKVGGSGLVITLENPNYGDGEYIIAQNNYDEFYDALIKGACVTIETQEVYLNCWGKNGSWSGCSFGDLTVTNAGYSQEIVSQWEITDIGLIVITWNFRFVFPNGSHNLPKIEAPAE